MQPLVVGHRSSAKNHDQQNREGTTFSRADHRAIADAALAPASNDFSASLGFSALIKVSPIRNALYPAARNRAISVPLSIPLSATASTFSGIRSANRSTVAKSTLNVRRS